MKYFRCLKNVPKGIFFKETQEIVFIVVNVFLSCYQKNFQFIASLKLILIFHVSECVKMIFLNLALKRHTFLNMYLYIFKACMCFTFDKNKLLKYYYILILFIVFNFWNVSFYIFLLNVSQRYLYFILF